MSPRPADSAAHASAPAFALAMDTAVTTTARINKFDGSNFHLWKFKMQMVLEERDLWDVVCGEVKPEHLSSPLDQATYKRKSRKTMAMICFAMEESQLPFVRSANGAHDAWSRLEGHFCCQGCASTCTRLTSTVPVDHRHRTTATSACDSTTDVSANVR